MRWIPLCCGARYVTRFKRLATSKFGSRSRARGAVKVATPSSQDFPKVTPQINLPVKNLRSLSGSMRPARVVACPNQRGWTGMRVLWKISFYSLALQWFGCQRYNVFCFFVKPKPAINVSGLSLWSDLIRRSFHTTQMDEGIFYHHYCLGFKLYKHNCGQAVRIIHSIVSSVVSAQVIIHFFPWFLVSVGTQLCNML